MLFFAITEKCEGMDEKRKIIKREQARRELARRHFSRYLPYVYGNAWITTRFGSFLAEAVQQFLETDTGHAYDILIINTPPQHGKSMTVSESLPSWVLGKHPDWRIIVAAYNDDLAGRFMRRNKEKIKEKCGKLWGIEIGDIDRADAIELKAPHRGGILSRGIRGGITGNPANLIIIDDPIKSREEADSETWRGKVWDEWQNSIKSRLAPGAKVIVIMTPWHEDDLSARILQTEQNATLIRLPVEAEEDDPLGRAVGEPLCPELGKDAAWLADFKKSYLNDPQGGSRAWSALYQCNPRVEGGNIIRREWWKFYNPKEIDWFGTEVISVDATFKKTDTSDYVAITVWGKRGMSDYYLRYCLNKRMTFSETLQAIRATRALYPLARSVLVEDKANGSAIIDVLQREMFCIAINPKGGKAARVNAVQPAIESGHVFLPEGEPWVADYVDQWCAFPAGAHDDMVDSSTQALGYMLFTSGAALPGKTDEQDEWTLGKYDDVLADSDTLFDPYGMGGF